MKIYVIGVDTSLYHMGSISELDVHLRELALHASLELHCVPLGLGQGLFVDRLDQLGLFPPDASYPLWFDVVFLQIAVAFAIVI